MYLDDHEVAVREVLVDAAGGVRHDERVDAEQMHDAHGRRALHRLR